MVGTVSQRVQVPNVYCSSIPQIRKYEVSLGPGIPVNSPVQVPKVPRRFGRLSITQAKVTRSAARAAADDFIKSAGRNDHASEGDLTGTPTSSEGSFSWVLIFSE